MPCQPNMVRTRVQTQGHIVGDKCLQFLDHAHGMDRNAIEAGCLLIEDDSIFGDLGEQLSICWVRADGEGDASEAGAFPWNISR